MGGSNATMRTQEIEADMISSNKCFIAKLPEEVLGMLLSYVDIKTQKAACRQVCKRWKYVVENESLRKQAIALKLVPRSYPKQPWYLYVSLLYAYGRNLLHNPCGIDKMNGWNIIHSGGNGWGIERPPVGSSLEIPGEAFVAAGVEDNGVLTCFCTSFSACQKEQIITLKDHAISEKLMDEVRPEIEISEWYAARFDCASKYTIQVELLDINCQPIYKPFSFTAIMGQWTEANWKQVKYVFKDYGPGVRCIRFCHMGRDTQFWNGHYGPKMTLATVKLKSLY